MLPRLLQSLHCAYLSHPVTLLFWRCLSTVCPSLQLILCEHLSPTMTLLFEDVWIQWCSPCLQYSPLWTSFSHCDPIIFEDFWIQWCSPLWAILLCHVCEHLIMKMFKYMQWCSPIVGNCSSVSLSPTVTLYYFKMFENRSVVLDFCSRCTVSIFPTLWPYYFVDFWKQWCSPSLQLILCEHLSLTVTLSVFELRKNKWLSHGQPGYNFRLSVQVFGCPHLE